MAIETPVHSGSECLPWWLGAQPKGEPVFAKPTESISETTLADSVKVENPQGVRERIQVLYDEWKSCPTAFPPHLQHLANVTEAVSLKLEPMLERSTALAAGMSALTIPRGVIVALSPLEPLDSRMLLVATRHSAYGVFMRLTTQALTAAAVAGKGPMRVSPWHRWLASRAPGGLLVAPLEVISWPRGAVGGMSKRQAAKFQRVSNDILELWQARLHQTKPFVISSETGPKGY
eukprot:GHVT01045149.1.p1 GENE.GHVT01045149.1~~GHVT01045149.1.p1  ORF type:complete len:233 (-),score=17.44 GHVT01045149.1:580-1278(-)